MEQIEITEWERKNAEQIVGWEINYGIDSDEIVFKMKDGTKKQFNRHKTITTPSL